jgi:hypothetical protein
METVISTEQQLLELNEGFPPGYPISYFKFVGVGPNTQAELEHSPVKICEMVKNQEGYFIIGPDVRKQMHELVDRFCDIQEKINESKT